MKASVGDHIVIASNKVDQGVREGTIVEVHEPDGGPPYVVEWEPGHTSVVFPGPDAHIERHQQG